MNDRHFLWGLSGGVSVCAIAGFFWFGLGVAVAASRAGWFAVALSTAFQVATLLALLVSAFRLRRRSGFDVKDLRNGNDAERRETRRIRTTFGWTTLGQTVLVSAGVWACVRFDRRDLIWPWIGFVVSLHFLPLARVFHVRAYYAIAAIGGLISLAVLTGIVASHNLLAFGGSMALLMWLSGAYLVWNADRITAKAVRQPWAN